MMNDAFEMREQHQDLLERSRSYLIHNLCPTEDFWHALLTLDILEPEMLDSIKSQQSRSEKVTGLIDILPRRGPDAFDGFLVALLKCGHGFVADYLKILEAADQFKKNIHNYNISEPIQERLVRTFKSSLPNIQRFFETKLEVNVQEQELEFQEKEREIDDLQEQVKGLEEEIVEVKCWFKSAVERCTDLGTELKRQYISRSMLREERKHLEHIYEKAASQEKHEKVVSDFHDGMHAVLDYIEKTEDKVSQLEHALNCADEESQDQEYGESNGRTITAKVQSVMDLLANVLEKAVAVVKPEEENDVRNELERSIGRLKDIIKDLRHVKKIFLLTLRKKEDLSQETLSLVNNFREIRRLEQEMNEQEKHVQDLKKRGQVFKVKSKKHKRQQEQIQDTISVKERALTDLHDSLQKQVSSADQRVHFILSLLPDSTEGEEGSAEVKPDTNWTPFSRGGTSLAIYPDRSDSRYSLRSDVNDELGAPSTARSTVTEKPSTHQHCHSTTPTPQSNTAKKTPNSTPTPIPSVPVRKPLPPPTPPNLVKKSSPSPPTLPVRRSSVAPSDGGGHTSVRERPVLSVNRPTTKPATKGLAMAEKVSRETISAAQKRLPPNSPTLSGGTSPRKDTSRPTRSLDTVNKPGSAGRDASTPDRSSNIDKNKVKFSETQPKSDSAKYRPSTPDDKKDEKQEKNEKSRNIIQVRPAEEASRGKTDSVGKSESAGKLDSAGKLESARKLDSAGKLESAGKPDSAGKLEFAGKPDSAEKPDSAGKPDSASLNPPKPSPPVLTRQLSQTTNLDKPQTTPRRKYTDPKTLARPAALSISSAKTVSHLLNPGTATVKASITGFDRSYNRAVITASNSKPIQTQHADLKVETQIMLRDRTPGPALRIRLNNVTSDHRDPGSPNVSARGHHSIVDRDSLSQSWLVRSAVSTRPADTDTTNTNPVNTYPPSKKLRSKVDPNRLGSNIDKLLKESKPESFYGRVTDAINRVKMMDTAAPSPSNGPTNGPGGPNNGPGGPASGPGSASGPSGPPSGPSNLRETSKLNLTREASQISTIDSLVNGSASRSANWSGNGSASQSASQLASQSASKLASQSATWSASGEDWRTYNGDLEESGQGQGGASSSRAAEQ